MQDANACKAQGYVRRKDTYATQAPKARNLGNLYRCNHWKAQGPSDNRNFHYKYCSVSDLEGLNIKAACQEPQYKRLHF